MFFECFVGNCYEMVEEFDYWKFFLYFGPGKRERSCGCVTERLEYENDMYGACGAGLLHFHGMQR